MPFGAVNQTFQIAPNGLVDVRPPAGETWVLTGWQGGGLDWLDVRLNPPGSSAGTIMDGSQTNGGEGVFNVNTLAPWRGATSGYSGITRKQTWGPGGWHSEVVCTYDNYIRVANRNTGSTITVTVLGYKNGDLALRESSGTVAASGFVDFRPPAGKVWIPLSFSVYSLISAVNWYAQDAAGYASGALAMSDGSFYNGIVPRPTFGIFATNTLWLRLAGTGTAAPYRLSYIELDDPTGMFQAVRVQPNTVYRPPAGQVWQVKAHLSAGNYKFTVRNAANNVTTVLLNALSMLLYVDNSSWLDSTGMASGDNAALYYVVL